MAQVLEVPARPPAAVRGDLMVQTFATAIVLSDISAERAAQDAKWGEQNHPDGTGHDPTGFRAGLPAPMPTADEARAACEHAFSVGRGAWRDILVEEVAEALDESDPQALRTELIQVAAVATSWVEAIDRREVGL